MKSKVPSAEGDDLFTSRSRLKPIVLGALESPNHKWRTILGVTAETRLSVKTVKEIIAKCGDQVIKSRVPSREGDDLYTTAAHLDEIR